MPQLTVQLAVGREVEFTVAEPGPLAQTCFVLGVRKCGSSLMNSMIISLARINKRHFIDVAGTFFKADVADRAWQDDPGVLPLFIPGQVHGGFRGMPPILRASPVWSAARKVLLVRDPRDALVSEYFSTAYTHSVPTAQAEAGGARTEMLAARQRALASSVEAYVLEKAEALNSTMMAYADVVADPATKLFRYEDVILHKREWVQAIVEHFGWDPGSPAFMNGMMSWADVVPTEEQPDKFIRRVLPGDHKEKLSPAAIAKLNMRLAGAMGLFGYGP